jgi:predicted branched-subunit amino acid permease
MRLVAAQIIFLIQLAQILLISIMVNCRVFIYGRKMFYGHNVLVTQHLTKATLGLLNFDQIVGGTKNTSTDPNVTVHLNIFGWANK